MAESDDITLLLQAATDGSEDAADALYTAVYDELQRIARIHLGREEPGHTLQATELVHEAYLRLIDQRRVRWKGESHFLSVASRAMRRILVDHARGRNRQKRGGGELKLPLEQALDVSAEDADTTLLALDLALDKLAEREPDKARIVELHFFGGLTHDECAAVLGVSLRTVHRHWEYARSWLYREIATPPPVV